MVAAVIDASNSADPDGELDEFLSWIVRAVMADTSLGGSARDVVELSTVEPELEELSFEAVGGIVRFEVAYFTRWDNPEVN